MLGRLFCFNGGGPAPDWAAHAQYGANASSARARVLDLLADDLEERFSALGPAAAAGGASRSGANASQEAVMISRRLYGVNLPSAELGQCRDLLRKLAAIDGARVAAEAEREELAGQLKAAEGTHRQAEFARARAEAIATARGEALMNAQKATREAEQQSLQLWELLRMALDRLGLDADLALVKPSPLPPPPTTGAEATPSLRQSVFSKQHLALLAASVSRLPRQSIAALPPLHERRGEDRGWMDGGEAAGMEAVQSREQLRMQMQEEEEAFQRYRASQEQDRLEQQAVAAAAAAAEQQRQQARQAGSRHPSRPGSRHASRPASRHSSRERGAAGQEAAEAAQAERASLDGEQLSGFTVYTNDMDGEEQGRPSVDGEVARPDSRQRGQKGGGAAGRDSQGSGVQWRSISSAALSGRSGASEGPEGQHNVRGSRGSSQQRHQQGRLHGSQEHGGGGGEGQQQAQQGSKLRKHARQLSRLVLPGLDASQLDSLVRIGASMASPDRHLRGPAGEGPVEVAQQLLPPGWEQAAAQLGGGAGAINPLQSDANAEAFLSELHAEWQRQHGEAEGHGLALQQHRDGASGYEFYTDTKFPGAGTWVSPSLAAMLAHKKGYNPLLEGGEPSPPSHIKAVFGTTEDREFYGPMAAHLNRRDPPGEPRQAAGPAGAPPRPPTSASAESVHGRPRQLPPSNRSSFEGRRSAEALPGQQAAPTARQAATAAPAGPPAGLQHASVDQPPQRRQAALRAGFQPMGVHAQSSLALSQQQAAALGQPPRRSSVAVSQLGGGGSNPGSQRGSSYENLPAVAAGKGGAHASGLPPRGAQHQAQQQQQQAGGQQQPATKRSLDSMRTSVGGGAAAHNIQASLNAVDAAMAALRNANPHLSREQPSQRGAAPPGAQQQQQYAQTGRGGGPQRTPAHHTRTRSLPEVAELDMPLTAMGEGQRRREQAQQLQAAAAAGSGAGHREGTRY